MLPRAHVVPRRPVLQDVLDTSPVISTPKFTCKQINERERSEQSVNRLTGATHVRWRAHLRSMPVRAV